MYTIKRMPEFDEWLASLRDGMLMVMLGGPTSPRSQTTSSAPLH